MATTSKGDLAELMVAADLRRKGYKVAVPVGEDWDYDLIIEGGSSGCRSSTRNLTAQ
jgi:hypothetical protein